MMDQDEAVLAAAVEEGQRILSYEIEDLDRQGQLIERVLRLGVALLAGAIAVGSLFGTAGDMDLIVKALLGSALLANISSIGTATVVIADGGAVGGVATGPGIRLLSQSVADPDVTLSDLHRSLLATYTKASEWNRRSIARLVAGRGMALRLLFACTSLYLILLSYIAA